MTTILLACGVFFLSLGCTAWLLRSGSRLARLDQPNERSLHSSPTPRGGGLAVLAALFTGCNVVWAAEGYGTGPGFWILSGMLGIGLVSLLDDLVELSASKRLPVHLAAGALLAVHGMRAEAIAVPGLGALQLGWLAGPFAVLFCVWMINLFNFMDGMDGFAGGMGVIGFSVLAWFGWSAGEPEMFQLALLIACACLGFLLFNFPPARIFLGDVGSTSLGLAAAGLSLLGVSRGVFPLWIPVLVFSPFIVDATVTLLRRLLKREKIWEAHRSHYYQRLVQAGWSHRRAVLAEYALMAAASGSALAAWRRPEAFQAGVLAAWLFAYPLLMSLVARLERRRLREAGGADRRREGLAPRA